MAAMAAFCLVWSCSDAGKLDFQFMIPPVDEVDALLAALVLLITGVQYLVHSGKLTVTKAFSCSCSCCTDKISTPEKSTSVRMEKIPW